MTHFDPNDEANPSDARALYINAEWYLSKIHVLGAFSFFKYSFYLLLVSLFVFFFLYFYSIIFFFFYPFIIFFCRFRKFDNL